MRRAVRFRVGYTIYAARFDTDDLIHRIATAAMMLAAAMAVQIPTALGEGSSDFAAAYVGARAVLILLYLGVRFTIPEAPRTPCDPRRSASFDAEIPALPSPAPRAP